MLFYKKSIVCKNVQTTKTNAIPMIVHIHEKHRDTAEIENGKDSSRKK